MPTPTYNLPLIHGNSPISIVNDMNALATATDSALAALKAGTATAADLELIKQTAASAETTANNAVTAAARAQGAADSAQQTANTANASATTANENSVIANANSMQAKNSVDALTAKVPQLSESDQYFTGSSGLVPARGQEVEYTDWHWEWCNGVIRFTGRESISGTLPDRAIIVPAGAAKPNLPGGFSGVYTVAFGSIGNDSGRYLCELRYDTTSEQMYVCSQYLKTSSTRVFIDLVGICGMDLSKL